MRENIGFKSYGGVWYMLFLFAVFGGLGIWMLVAERWSIGFLAFGIAFAAIGYPLRRSCKCLRARQSVRRHTRVRCTLNRSAEDASQ